MDCSEDKTSDFFKAFLHSLRATCFQLVDFRNHVSIRGFLAVDVDGENQQHYVLSEIVSRGKDSGMRSFPLEVVTSSKSLDKDMTSAPERSPKHYSLSENTAASHFNNKSSRSSNLLTNKLSLKSRAKEKNHRHSTKFGSSVVDNKPPQPYVFQTVRSDPSNSTFVMEQGTRSPKCKRVVSSTNERECVPKCRVSSTTVNVSPRHRIQTVSGGTNNKTSIARNRRLTHSIRKDDPAFPKSSWSSSRKRLHKLSSASTTTNSTNSMDMYGDTGSSCEDNSAYPEQHPKRKEPKRPKSRRKKDNRSKPINKDVSDHPSFLSNGSIRGTSYSDNYAFSQLLDYDSDQDCSIMSVKPRYLVGLTDDVNNIIISEPNNVNLLSTKTPESKLRRKLFLPNEDILRFHGNSM